MNKYKKLVSNTAILAIGTFSSKLLVFFLMRLYTSYLTTAEYSIADLVSQTANLLIPIASAGITDAVFRFTMDKNADKASVFSTGFITVTIGSAFLVLCSPLISLLPNFGNYAWLIVFYVAASCLHSLCAQFIRAQDKTKQFAGQGILGTVITILLNIVFLIPLDMGVTGYVLSVVISDCIVTVFLFINNQLWKELKKPDKTLFKTMIKYSIPLIPTTIFWWVTNAADRYMVSGMLGDSINGLYSAAYKTPTLLILVSGIFIEAWNFSAVTERQSEDSREFFGIVFDSFQALIFIAASGLIAFAKIITFILVESSYYESWNYIPILVAATVFSSLVTFMGSVYLVEKKSILSFITAMIGAVINIVLNFALIKPLGPNGAAIATFMSYFIVFIIRAVNTQKYIKFEMHPFKLVINTLLIFVQTAFMVFELPGWIAVVSLVIVLIFIINFKPIIIGIKRVIGRKK